MTEPIAPEPRVVGKPMPTSLSVVMSTDATGTMIEVGAHRVVEGWQVIVKRDGEMTKTALARGPISLHRITSMVTSVMGEEVLR